MNDTNSVASAVAVGERSDEDVLAAGVRALSQILETRPYVAEELLEVIGHRLDGRIDDRTWTQIDTTLIDYFADRDAADVLGWALRSDSGDTQRLDELERNGGATVAELARRIIAKYGVELRNASGMRDFPDNWLTLSQNVYLGTAVGRTFISLTIEKQNGERCFLDGPADAAMSFAGFLLGALRLAGRDAFSEELLDQFVGDAEDLFKQWREVEQIAPPTPEGR